MSEEYIYLYARAMMAQTALIAATQAQPGFRDRLRAELEDIKRARDEQLAALRNHVILRQWIEGNVSEQGSSYQPGDYCDIASSQLSANADILIQYGVLGEDEVSGATSKGNSDFSFSAVTNQDNREDASTDSEEESIWSISDLENGLVLWDSHLESEDDNNWSQDSDDDDEDTISRQDTQKPGPSESKTFTFASDTSSWDAKDLEMDDSSKRETVLKPQHSLIQEFESLIDRLERRGPRENSSLTPRHSLESDFMGFATRIEANRLELQKNSDSNPSCALGLRYFLELRACLELAIRKFLADFSLSQSWDESWGTNLSSTARRSPTISNKSSTKERKDEVSGEDQSWDTRTLALRLASASRPVTGSKRARSPSPQTPGGVQDCGAPMIFPSVETSSTSSMSNCKRARYSPSHEKLNHIDSPEGS